MTLPSQQVATTTTSSKRSVGRLTTVERSPGRPAASQNSVLPVASVAAPYAAHIGAPVPDRRPQVETKSRLYSSLAAGWAGSVSMGVAIGYSLPASRSLGRVGGTTSGEGGSGQPLFWFDLMLPLGAIVGVLGSSFVAFILGRRRTLAVGSVGSLLLWAAISWASSDSLRLLLARAGQGIYTGIVSLVTPAYIAEIATPKDRGKQCGAHQTGIAAGVLYTYVLGHFTDWSQLALWCAVPSALTTALLLQAVESPRWLMEQKRRADAQAALRSLRPVASEAGNELEMIEVIYPKTPMPIVHYVLAVVVIISQQCSGVDVIMQYATGALQMRFGSPPQDEFILLAAIQLVMTAVAAQLLDLTGRVRPLAVSATLCASSMVILGTVYFVASDPAYVMDGTLASNLIFGTKVVFSAAFSAGLGPASWVLAVELVPLRGRGFDFFGSVCAFYWATAMTVVSMFATLGTGPLSLAVLSWLCGAITFAGGVTTFAFAPDTVGISIESILMEGQADRQKKADTREAVETSTMPRPGETQALIERKENALPSRLGGLTAERGAGSVAEAAGASLTEIEKKPSEGARVLPDGVVRTEAVSSTHSTLASTPSIHVSTGSRQSQKRREP